jgi:hypothetical protein
MQTLKTKPLPAEPSARLRALEDYRNGLLSRRERCRRNAADGIGYWDAQLDEVENARARLGMCYIFRAAAAVVGEPPQYVRSFRCAR